MEFKRTISQILHFTLLFKYNNICSLIIFHHHVSLLFFKINRIDYCIKWFLFQIYKQCHSSQIRKGIVYNRRVLDLPAYTSGNTFSFLVFEGRDKRFDPPAKCRESNFLNRIERATNCHSFSPSFASSRLTVWSIWSMAQPAALFTSSDQSFLPLARWKFEQFFRTLSSFVNWNRFER